LLAVKQIDLPNTSEIQFQLETISLEDDLLKYLKWTFSEIKKEEFLENWHHKSIADALMKVYRGELLHLIITLPPRYTKTELVIKSFVSWCLAKNPKCKFLHLSYSDDLALDNSSAIKEMVLSHEYQSRWPLSLKQDSQSKKKWYTEEGGGMYATATGGQITGFGAGAVGAKEFSGAILIDDPLKPDDANSDTVRNRMNERFNNTIKSRVNSKNTPIIIIQQRLHEVDMVGFLLDGGSEIKFFHLNLPALNEDGPSEYDPREKGVALWLDKHDEDELEAMRLADAATFAGQFQQRPAPEDGNIFKKFQFYKELPIDEYYKIHSWDMTFKAKSKGKTNKVDYVVGTEWGKSQTTKKIYMFPNMVRARMGYTDTETAVETFTENNPDYKAILVEDKANGSAILDKFQKKFRRMIAIEPKGDKVERAEAVAPLFMAGDIYLPHPSIAPWIEDYINEMKIFPNGKHDDQVDSTTQALEHLDNVGNLSLKSFNKKTKPFRNEFEKRNRKSRIKIKSY
jgi:predicted phage terminase large subunit-like protein